MILNLRALKLAVQKTKNQEKGLYLKLKRKDTEEMSEKNKLPESIYSLDVTKDNNLTGMEGDASELYIYQQFED